ncbi:SusF/SusE family outer membrane protein [Prolixibacter bellariivorans]|nr:SusF/SusE family outer membrane protein [Prolixibacter bellariivorans]
MKRKSIYMMIASFVTAAIVFAACTKEMSEVRLESKLTTTEKMDVTSDSATVVGLIVSEGQGITEKGIVYSTDSLPTVDDNKAVYSGNEKTAAFTVKIGGLDYATKYYARAYGITSSGTIYGAQLTFTTLPVPPTVTTADITSVTGRTATGGGEVTVSGGADVTARGVCYSTEHNPTLSNSFTTDGDSLGTFTSNLENLKGNTTYYVRAYATNSAGTNYGPEVSFKTEVALPIVTTTPISNLVADGATSGGSVTDNGGADVTVRGVCWSTSENPTISDSKTSDGTGTGPFTSTITGLAISTTYHVRAYAENSAGVAYGEDIQFSTYPTALYMVGDGVISDPSHIWDWTVDLPMIPVNSHPNMFWKIVWMTGTGGFKMNSVKDWDGNQFGTTGDVTGSINDPAGLVYTKGGENIPVPATPGYYMVVVDFATGKISISKPAVYLIGNVIGSWDTANLDGLFTVDNANSVIKITKTLANDDIRMYAWHPWFTDWWQSEFIILNDQIVFRGTGGDQTRVNVPAGSNTVALNFKTGAGSITQP